VKVSLLIDLKFNTKENSLKFSSLKQLARKVFLVILPSSNGFQSQLKSPKFQTRNQKCTTKNEIPALTQNDQSIEDKHVNGNDQDQQVVPQQLINLPCDQETPETQNIVPVQVQQDDNNGHEEEEVSSDDEDVISVVVQPESGEALPQIATITA
ncbi:hypothetical protein ACH5RR_023625, partial [Cinchona calisaya]